MVHCVYVLHDSVVVKHGAGLAIKVLHRLNFHAKTLGKSSTQMYVCATDSPATYGAIYLRPPYVIGDHYIFAL